VFHENSPKVAVFTPIHVDHVKFLGNTPMQNIIEKIDIIKDKTTVVSAPQTKEVANFIQNYCDNQKYFFLGIFFNKRLNSTFYYLTLKHLAQTLYKIHQ
jgi:folylpolyglutamate synthase/dihydropteroate synthase